ncbi:MAG: M28 family peptidase [Thermoanaerobaculia bacterium]
MTEASAENLVALAGKKLGDLVAAAKKKSFRPVALGALTSLVLPNRMRSVATANVAGLLPGSDPALSREAVIYTAHHDHLGIGDADESGDTVYNGAVDNASGSAEILAIARAFASCRPRHARAARSSSSSSLRRSRTARLGALLDPPHLPHRPHRRQHQPRPANIYGRTRDITYVGYGKSTLDAVVDRAAAAQGRTVKGDQAPEKGSFYRSTSSTSPARRPRRLPRSRHRLPRAGRRREAAAAGELRLDPVITSRATRSNRRRLELRRHDRGRASSAFAVGLEIANADAMPTWNPATSSKRHARARRRPPEPWSDMTCASSDVFRCSFCWLVRGAHWRSRRRLAREAADEKVERRDYSEAIKLYKQALKSAGELGPSARSDSPVPTTAWGHTRTPSRAPRPRSAARRSATSSPSPGIRRRSPSSRPPSRTPASSPLPSSRSARSTSFDPAPIVRFNLGVVLLRQGR